jgi:glycerophosphoryl diester phosphodiesterase
VIAHRGFSARHRENTLAAFEAAIEAGADMIELDVGSSADGVPVVLHDDPPPLAARELPVPTLDEVFSAVGPRIPLNVELKRTADPAAVRDLVRAHGLDGSVLLSCFDHARLTPLLPRGLLFEGPLPAEAVALCRRHSAFSCHPEAAFLVRDDVARLRAAGLRVLAWTVDDGERLRALARWGVDGVFTNDPERARAVLHGGSRG